MFSSENLRDARSSIIFAQSHKLIYAARRLHVTPSFEIVHHRSADCAMNYRALIEHCELNDHSVEVVAPHLALL
jgi:hypothetical protein